MVTNTIKSELFFELVYALSGLSGEDDILAKSLPMYLRKLNCFAACIVKMEGEAYTKKAILPKVFQNNDVWKDVLNQASQQGDSDFQELHRQDGSYYLYRLEDYGLLILGRKKPLEAELAHELAPIAGFLGRSLKQALDHELRKAAEAQTRDREALNDLIMNSAFDAIAIVDGDGTVRYWNSAAENIFGWTAAEMQGTKMSESIIPHGMRHAHDSGMERFRKTGEAKVLNRLLELPAMHRSGREFPIELSIITLNQGDKDFYCGFMKDISHRKEKDEIIRQQLELQDLLIKISSTYINIDLDKVEIAIQDSLEDMGRFVGADRAYIFEYDFKQLTVSNTFEWCTEGITAEMANLQEVPIEYIPQWVEQHRKGEPFYIPDISQLPEDGPDGLRAILEPQGIQSLIAIPMRSTRELIGFVGFDSVRSKHEYTDKERKLLFLFAQLLINVFERKHKEKLLATQEEKYRNIIANMNLGLLEVDRDEKIIFANQSFCDISGYAIEELVGHHTSILLSTTEDIALLNSKDALRDKGVSDNYELAVRNKAGEPRWWFISGAPNYNDKGERVGSIGIHLDITRQKELEQELAVALSKAEEASKAKEAFLANMSHEIRTPLNAIIGMIRELGREDLTPKQQLYLSHSETAARHLLNILNNVLDISKIEAGEFDLDIREFSLSSVISNVKSILMSKANEKGLRMNVLVSPDIAPCHIGDGTRIRQILINLIGNAIKFTEEGKVSLIVEVDHEDARQQTIKFTIQDTGVGMSEVFMDKLFSKFSQEEDKTTRRFEGTGLGMAITQEMIQLMDGQIAVSSLKNQGTTIAVRLQLPIGDPAKLYSAPETPKAGSLRGVRVLLVEDNDMNRYIATQSLRHFDCEVTEAINGQDAIDKLARHPIDIVLMDIQMPVMDGVEATRHIRQHISRTLPIIALTANAFKKDIDHYLAVGMNDYVTKPFEENLLFTTIANHTASQRTQAIPVGEGQPLYDLSKLREISRGDTLFLHKMISIFAEQTPIAISDMKAALAAGQWDSMSKLAHRIKPSIDNMGIISLQSVVRDIESKAKSDQPDAMVLAALLAKTETVIANVLELLRMDFPEVLE
jgi:PAS domain S-box-containing protein